MQHIHVFVGTHKEVADATKAAVGRALAPSASEVETAYPELTHSVVAVASLDGGERHAYCISLLDSCVVEDKEVRSLYMNGTFANLMKLLTEE